MLNTDGKRTVIRCVSHQCVLWNKWPLSDADVLALSRAHKYAHRAMNSADIPQEKPE